MSILIALTASWLLFHLMLDRDTEQAPVHPEEVERLLESVERGAA